MTTTARAPAGGFALRLTDVSVALGGVPILSHINFEPAVGKLNAIIGPNGAGKTTLLRAILELLPYTGTIERGRNSAGKPLRMGYVPQRLDFDRGMPLSVIDFLCCGMQYRPLWLGHAGKARRIARRALARVGGNAWENQLLGKLSGGELQRVLLAVALTTDPDILLLDEPVSGVDISGEQLFCDLLGSLQKEGKYTMLLVSHDLSIVTQHAEYILCLNQTVQCQGRTVETLTADNLKALYKYDVGLYGHTGVHEGIRMTIDSAIPVLDWWTQQGLPAIHYGLQRVLPFEWARYPFMLNALIECVLLAPICAAMGVKVVNFRMAFFSDAISHSAFAGVALGFVLNELFARWGGHFDPRLALIMFGLLVGLGIAFVRRKTDLSTDTVVGVVFSSVIAFGLAIITTSGSRTLRFQPYLYGDILTLDAADLALSFLLGLIILLFMLFSFNSLTLIGLNAEMAHSRGVAVRVYDYLFSLLLALVVTVSIRTAGILLVTAMLVVPAAAARNMARDMGGMFRWALVIGLFSGVAGTLASYSEHLANIGTGAVIVLTSALLFAVSFFFARR